MKVYNVELSFPNGSWRTIQTRSELSSEAAYMALEKYPAAASATAWLPGGPRGLDRTEETKVTSLAHALGAEPVPESGWTVPLSSLLGLPK